ncbi:hypothetical protein [Streptomyces sp. NPDC006134]
MSRPGALPAIGHDGYATLERPPAGDPAGAVRSVPGFPERAEA